MHAPSAATPHWWQWPTICSLDAPLIALVWQWLLARVAGVPLRMPEAAVLGASVWLAYVGDRWIEGWHLAPSRTSTHRHRFYQRNRWPVATIGLVVLVLDVSVAVHNLSRAEFEAGLLLLGAVLTYLLSHQLVHRDLRWRPPKEICVAALIAGGVAVFLVTQPHTNLSSLLPPLGLFTLLCFANCALISAWEHEIDVAHGQTSLARQFRQGAAISRTLPWMLALLSGAAAVTESHAARVAAICALGSSLLLGTVDAMEPRLGRSAARVLADFALLTPLAPLILSWRPVG